MSLPMKRFAKKECHYVKLILNCYRILLLEWVGMRGFIEDLDSSLQNYGSLFFRLVLLLVLPRRQSVMEIPL